MTEPNRKLAAILSADVVAYSKLMADNEAATVETLQKYRSAVDRVIARRKGRVVNAPGDNILAEFPSAVEAVAAAVEIQKSIEGRNLELPETRRMQLRVGVNLGDVIEEADGTIYGDGVNIAARMEALADAGGICISSAVYEAVQGKIDFGFDFLGEQQVKNIDRPINVYRVRGEQAQTPAPRRLVPLLGATAAISVVVAASVYWWTGLPRGEHSSPVGASSPDVSLQSASDSEPAGLKLPTGPSIAVMPFKNISGDMEQVYFADGMTEEVIAELTRFRELMIFGSNTTFSYKGQVVDAREVHRDLGADYVLEGSVRRAGDTLRVTAQFLDAETGANLWAETYERELTAANIFDVQDQITDAVVTAVAQSHGVINRSQLERLSRLRPDQLSAYDCVLKTQEYYRHFNQEEHARVRDCLQGAVDREPEYAKAWAYLGVIYLDEFRFGWNTLPEPLVRSREALERAIELDPRDGMGHTLSALTSYFEKDLDRFERDVKRALELVPNDSWILAILGEHVSLSGRYEQGAEMLLKAARMNPEHPGWYNWGLWRWHYINGDSDRALEHARKLGSPGFHWQHAFISLCLADLGRLEEANEAMEEALRLKPDLIEKWYEELTKFNWTPETKVLRDKTIESARKLGYVIDRGSM